MARSRASQSGVAAIFAGVALVTLLAALALAIDVGRLYFAQRDLQRVADGAAMDAARLRSQCLGAAGEGDVTAEAVESLKRNGAQDIQNPTVTLGQRKPHPGADDVFEPMPEALADSVQVAVSRSSPTRILPLFQGDQARTLKAKAAATATAKPTVAPRLFGDAAATDPAFANTYYGDQLGGTLGLTASQYALSANASVQVNKVVATPGSSVPGVNLPAIDEPITTLGLLNQILAALDAQGDAAAATVVSAFAGALDAGRAGVMVVPADLLGLPPGTATSTYDSATVPLANLLDSVAAAASGGDPLKVNLNLPEPLGDVTLTTQRPQPPIPATTSDGSSTSETTQSATDAISHRSAFVGFEINVLDPASGLPVKLHGGFDVPYVDLKITSMRCARLGQANHLVYVRSTRPTTVFALGNVPPIDNSTRDVLEAINKTTPVEILKLNVIGYPVAVTAKIDPTPLGSPGEQNFCFEGPPWKRAVQCDGSPAYAGNLDSRDVAPTLMGVAKLQLAVQLPNNLPLGLGPAVQDAANAQLAGLTKLLQDQLGLLVGQLVPYLDNVGLRLGAVPIMVDEAPVTQPTIFAR